MSFSRAAQHTQSKLKLTTYIAGVPTNATGTPTVKIMREDGTVLVAAGTAVIDEPGTGLYSYTLSPAQTAALDVLKVEWTATLESAAQIFTDYVEIVGDFLFTIADARRLSPLDDDAQYPVEDIVRIRTAVEIALEDACSQAFVPRYARELLDGDDTVRLRLRRTATSITSLTVDGVALDAGELAALDLRPFGGLEREAEWPLGRQNIVVKYVHGFPEPPPLESRAALSLARAWLVDGDAESSASIIDSRAIKLTQEGAGSIDLRPISDKDFSDLPEVNSIVRRWSQRGLRLT